MKQLIFFALCSLASGVTHMPALASDEPMLDEEIVVVGRRPGPPMWRVTHGDHTMFVFALVEPLPRGFQWDSASVDHVLSESSAYLPPPYVTAQTRNPLKALGFARKKRKLEKLSGKTRLHDLIPESLADEVREIAARNHQSYRNLSRYKPLFAAEQIWQRGLSRSGFSLEDVLIAQIDKLVKRHDVERVESLVDVPLDRVLEILAVLPEEEQISCLRTTVRSLETDIHAARVRAEAWLGGDASALRLLDYPDVGQACRRPMFFVPAAAEAVAESRRVWLDNAGATLRNHSVSFATLPAREIFASDGLLTSLEKRGFMVHGQ